MYNIENYINHGTANYVLSRLSLIVSDQLVSLRSPTVQSKCPGKSKRKVAWLEANPSDTLVLTTPPPIPPKTLSYFVTKETDSSNYADGSYVVGDNYIHENFSSLAHVEHNLNKLNIQNGIEK